MKEIITLKNAIILNAIGKEKKVVIWKSKRYWVHDIMSNIENKVRYGKLPENLYSWNFYPAYTTNELLQRLPDRRNNEVLNYSRSLRKFKYTKEEQEKSNEILQIEKTGDVFYEIYIGEPFREGHTQFVLQADTPQDALCLLLTELIKQNLI